jgi:hypothetical protein
VDKWNSLILLAVALVNGYTAWAASRAHTIAVQTAVDVHAIEKATNSMKDALVAATDMAAHAKGKEEGRLQEQALGERKAADVALGVKEAAAAAAAAVKSTPPLPPVRAARVE